MNNSFIKRKTLNILFNYYKFRRRSTRYLIIKAIRYLDNGDFYSATMRKIFKYYHDVQIGLFTHGGCFVENHMDRYTTIGNYCSIAHTAVSLNTNHNYHFKSSHAFFFNHSLDIINEDKTEYIPLEIQHDVWLGHNSIIMPHVRKIGTGAVVAAGAVVNKDVPPYAVVVGNPARIVRYRFSPETIERLLQSKWWEKSIEEIKNSELEEYIKPYVNGEQESSSNAQ